MDKKNIWFITAKTNLHVGDENTSSYGLIDKAVQRDALTGLPCINSSSLKGALNEYCCHGNNGKELLDSNTRTNIFGGDKKNKDKETKKGSYTFFDANILCLPKQDDTSFYKLVSCQKVVDMFIEKARLFGITIDSEKLKSEFGYSIICEEEFETLCSDDNLPIIARNCLENGESTNLWYEQILPAETVFYTLIDDKGDGKPFERLEKAIVQIGANATIGYGYCKFKHYNTEER